MKRIHSIILVTEIKSGLAAIAVCETENDEKDVLRHAKNQNHNVATIARAVGDFKRYPIFLNDYEL